MQNKLSFFDNVLIQCLACREWLERAQNSWEKIRQRGKEGQIGKPKEGDNLKESKGERIYLYEWE